MQSDPSQAVCVRGRGRLTAGTPDPERLNLSGTLCPNLMAPQRRPHRFGGSVKCSKRYAVIDRRRWSQEAASRPPKTASCEGGLCVTCPMRMHPGHMGLQEA